TTTASGTAASAADASVARSSATGSSAAGAFFFVAFFVAFDAVFLVALVAFLVAFADFLAVFFGAGSFDGTSGWLVCKESRSCVTSAVESAACAFLVIPIFPAVQATPWKKFLIALPACTRGSSLRAVAYQF